MCHRITLLLAAVAATAALAAPAHAELTWGAFKDNGCINPITHPGLASRSAVLWGIPSGESWEETCAKTPATIDGMRFAHPAVCVNTNAVDPLIFGGYAATAGGICSYADSMVRLFSGRESSSTSKLCATPILGWTEALEEISRSSHYDKPSRAIAAQGKVKWPFKAAGSITPAERSSWQQKLADAVGKNGVGQTKMGMGGLNIWGVFAVPDERCLLPDYFGLKDAPHARAAVACTDMQMRLCRQDELCQGGQPLLSKPEGDVWAAVGDGPNTWVSIGTSYPERLCRTHRDVIGQPPPWGDASGPQPHTGKPTAFRCCH